MHDVQLWEEKKGRLLNCTALMLLINGGAALL